MRVVSAVLVIAGLAMIAPLHAENVSEVRVLAAGSLRDAFGEISVAFQNRTGIKVETGFGPSGTLRDRIERGGSTDLFASADLGNAVALYRAGRAGPVVLFARNSLCALVRPGLSVASDNLLSVLLDPHTKLATSTPKTDPLGDYTWAVFGKADAVRPGSSAILGAKAQKLIGGPPITPPPPAGMDVFAWHLREGHADIFIEYCSAAVGFKRDLPGATVVNLRPELATGAQYGLTLLPTNNQNAANLALFILSMDGQEILARTGFDAPLLAGRGGSGP
jgi:ABC-type molybdate transport system substrate-binding protein